ncbi:Transcriptional regulator [Candidatus Magnetomoraceae bacterium gMMP-15]
MPRICYFLGISIYMYWNEHAPPHFHAVYNDYGGVVSIKTGEVIRGKLPPKVSSLIKEWVKSNQTLLMNNWQLAQENKELKPIKPLE